MHQSVVRPESRSEGPALDASVIVPVYNCESYIGALLESILNQEGVSFEVIAVCDGATDGSLSVIEAIAERDPRLIVVSQPNSGPSVARNTGLSLARGEWILFADGDDLLRSGMLACMIARGRAEHLDIVLGNGIAFAQAPDFERAAPLLSKQPWERVCDGKTWVAHAVQHQEWPHYVWLQCLRRAFVEKIGLRFEAGIVHEDMIWTLHIARHAQRMAFIAEPQYAYRTNPTSLCNSPSQQRVREQVSGYLRGLAELVDVARKENATPAFRRALFRQAALDAEFLLRLVSRRITEDSARARYATQFVNAGYGPVFLQEARNTSQAWRALRCWLKFSILARKVR
ncbi:glycosyltransferase [Robbsia sp. KACC 23696]|uniref:glycosyltransferase n=1 Tax=Robbsia sp. KACC 23696 TaxID=3149231 RepID=UPI00325B817C